MSRIHSGLIWISLGMIVLVGFMDLGQVKPYLFAGLVFVLIALGTFHIDRMIGRKFSGEAVLRQARAVVPWWIMVLALSSTLSYFMRSNKDPYVVIMWWFVVSFSVFTAMRIKRSKPVMCVLRGNDLLINGHSISSRDLSTLTRIEFNGMFNFFRLRFEHASPITIEQHKYHLEELHAFLEHVLRRAGPNVALSDNIRHLNTSAGNSAS
jgi:hypothetical protein